MKGWKHNIANFLRKHKLSNSVIYKILLFFNNYVFHYDKKQVKRSYGEKNPDKTFYMIRVHSLEEGLISLVFHVMKKMEYALDRHYIPFVDFENSKTQYSTGELIHGTRNAWEYYFKQPSDIPADEIYQSMHVIVSGRDYKLAKKEQTGRYYRMLKHFDFYHKEKIHELYCFIKKNMDIQPYIYEQAEKIRENVFQRKEVIGVFMRGTDYTAFCPSGHPVQPEKERVYEDVVAMKEKHPYSKIFLVTEDDDIYRYFKRKLQDELLEIDDIRFSGYRGDDYIFKYCKGNAYQIGLQYLIKLLLLAGCDYLVSSVANGSVFANIMNDNRYREKVIIDLGVYE